MKTEWSHLPNAVHIDRILASVKAQPDVWVAAQEAAWAVARSAAWSAARSVARSVAWAVARSAAWAVAGSAAWAVAGDAMVALIAWDDCSQYLDMTSEQLEMWYHLTERPACLLLLPAVRAFEQIAEMELVA